MSEESLKYRKIVAQDPSNSARAPASKFYYYVYVALPGDEWSPQAWGLAARASASEWLKEKE